MTLNDLWEAAFAVILAAAGGLARLLNRKGKKPVKWRQILAEMFIAAFMGVLIFLLSRGMEVGGYYMYLLAGVAGWAGPRVIDSITRIAGAATGVDLSKVKSKEDTQ